MPVLQFAELNRTFGIPCIQETDDFVDKPPGQTNAGKCFTIDELGEK